MTDGSNHAASLGYNPRRQITHFEISSAVSQNYEYYNDGRIKLVDNLNDANFDRNYFYDHAARLTIAGTGAAVSQESVNVPSWETFEYDPLGHTTRRYTEVWAQDDYLDVGSYQNNRRTGWGYDADGRLKTIDTRQYNYDAAGQPEIMIGQMWGGASYLPTSIASGFDGDGNRVKEVSTNPGFTFTTYYLRSSALGGAIVQEINSAPQTIGYVYTPDGQLLAKQMGGVGWKHRSPGGATEIDTGQGGFGRRELDPVGADVPLTQPPPQSHFGGDGDIDGSRISTNIDSLFADLANPAAGCTLDRLFAPCDWITRLGRADGLAEEQLALQRRPIQTHGQPGRAPTKWSLKFLDPSPIVDVGLGLFIRGVPVPARDTEGSWFDLEEELFTLQQNTERPLTPGERGTLGSDIQKLLQGRKDCIEFVSSLLLTVATQTQRALHSTDFISDPMKIFDAVAGSPRGGYFLDPAQPGAGRASGGLATGDAKVILNVPFSGFSFVRGLTGLHENTHQASGVGILKYTDRELAFAAYHAWAQGFTNLPSPPKSDDAAANSKYWDEFLFAACSPNQRRK